MSTNKRELKLGSLKLKDSEKEAIAEMVESDGFKAWKNKVMPNRELKIAGAALAANSVEELFRAKGQSYENGKQIVQLEDIARAYNKNPDKED